MVFLRGRRFTGEIFGVVFLVGTIFKLADGNQKLAIIGFALGVGIIAIWEWVIGRARS